MEESYKLKAQGEQINQQDSNDDKTTDLNNQSEVEIFVKDELVGQRLDVMLKNSLDVLPSRTCAARLISEDFVLIDNKKTKPSYKLRLGDKISISLKSLQLQKISPQPENISLDIIYEDKEIIIINKQAGLVVHPGAGVKSGTLVNAILAHCGFSLPFIQDNQERAGIVHRLDRDTSGVMVVAKTQAALSHLSQQFASHKHQRIYQALVLNSPQNPQGTIETRHGRDPFNRLKYAVLQGDQGKYAKLSYKTLDIFLQGIASLVECELFTGRTHQIRVQMRYIGCPILGDQLYGCNSQKLIKQKELFSKISPYLTRQMLHAKLLTIIHPSTDKSMTFTALPPQDFRTIQEILKNASIT